MDAKAERAREVLRALITKWDTDPFAAIAEDGAHWRGIIRDCLKLADALAAERDALREEVREIDEDRNHWMDATAHFRDQAVAAEAECARLREDVARLDWLTAHIDNGGSFDGLGFDHEDWDDSIEWSDCGKDEPTFRDLIDAARTPQGIIAEYTPEGK